MAGTRPTPRAASGPGSKDIDVVRYGFLLLPEFPMYALIPAVEALRIANQNSGRTLYSWHFFSGDGKPVKAGNGMSMPVEAAVADVPFFPDGLRLRRQPPDAAFLQARAELAAPSRPARRDPRRHRHRHLRPGRRRDWSTATR